MLRKIFILKKLLQNKQLTIFYKINVNKKEAPCLVVWKKNRKIGKENSQTKK